LGLLDEILPPCNAGSSVIDPDEYPNLAAYSDFRMLLAEIQKGS
jgi:hypothetical protein